MTQLEERVAKAMLADELENSAQFRDFDREWANEEAIWLQNAKAAIAAIGAELSETLRLADAALSGANMNMNVVKRRVKTALAELAEEGQ